MYLEDADRRPNYFPPAFCDSWGSDEFGLWATFTVRVRDTKRIEQRMRWIEPGTFLMGSPSDEPERNDCEGPQHLVTLTHGFWLADTACTRELWAAVMGGVDGEIDMDAQLPMTGVSCLMAQSFLKALSCLLADCRVELPTEAQWEYACRAGSATAFSAGMNINCTIVNYHGDHPYAGNAPARSQHRTLRVKSMLANSWGLYEMHGNVWEWCSDGPRKFSTADVSDPLGPVQDAAGVVLRVMRGGSFASWAGATRSAFRAVKPANAVSEESGFRICSSVAK